MLKLIFLFRLLFGLSMSFDSDKTAAGSVQDLLQSFLRDAVGNDKSVSKALGGFSLSTASDDLVQSLISSLTIGARLDLNVAFGLDLEPVFNSSKASLQERLPEPFVQINHFNLDAKFGVNEWTASLKVDPFLIGISEARALCKVKAISNDPFVISSPVDLKELIAPAGKIDISASLDVSLPIFSIYNGFGFGARIRYNDTNLLDKEVAEVDLDLDVYFSIEAIQKAAGILANNTKFLANFEPFRKEIPLLQTTVNKLVTGDDGRTVADLFDLTDWANTLTGTPKSTLQTSAPSLSLEPSYSSSPSSVPSLSSQPSRKPLSQPTPLPTPSPTLIPSYSKSPSATPSHAPTRTCLSDSISLSELKKSIRNALQQRLKPNSNSDEIPSMPDASSFEVTRNETDICAGNDKAISVDIGDGDGQSGLELTLCSLLEFKLPGNFDARDLLDSIEESVDLDATGKFELKGVLSFGARLSVRNGKAELDLDPIKVQILVESKLHMSVSLGIIEIGGNADAKLKGIFQVAYCPDCNGVKSDFVRLSNSSSFYWNRQLGYDLTGSLALGATLPGVEVDTGLTVSIKDENVFDNNPPKLKLPDSEALRNSLKFSPTNALRMLKIVDGLIVEASRNKALNAANIPLLNKPVSEVFSVGRIFTSKLVSKCKIVVCVYVHSY